MKYVMGIDLYNQCTTGERAKTITNKADNEHIPCVLIMESNDSNCYERKTNGELIIEVTE